ncbi:MAG: F0F1 ATP synthase subunit delta [Micrococcales bacterium]|nr:MAG: F0F1 ATP synthase subunit delta [Micrococcales bacterium]PIE27661.1 MAG: F0F1 ATP synthase subunit delta [Micrococcales bacterium]
MRGASADSLHRAQQRLDGKLEQGGGADLAGGLFSVAGVLGSSAQLRRTLTDPNLDGEAKVGLAQRLLDGKVSEATLDVIRGLVSSRWSSARDLGDAMDDLGVRARIAQADAEGSLDEVEDQVFRFSRILAGDARLYAAFTDRAASEQARAQLATTLIGDKANPHAVALIEHAVRRPRGRLEEAMDRIGTVIAARRQRSVAIVSTPVDLDNLQRARLAQVLAHMYGREIQLKIDRDPGVVGGLRIQVGDEIIDGSVLSRLHRAERNVAG